MERRTKTEEKICVFFAKKKVRRGGLAPKCVKRHNGLPLRNKYTMFHWATSDGRGKKIREKFFVFFFSKNPVG